MPRKKIDLPAADIYAAYRDEGWTLSSLAKVHKVSRNTIKDRIMAVDLAVGDLRFMLKHGEGLNERILKANLDNIDYVDEGLKYLGMTREEVIKGAQMGQPPELFAPDESNPFYMRKGHSSMDYNDPVKEEYTTDLALEQFTVSMPPGIEMPKPSLWERIKNFFKRS